MGYREGTLRSLLGVILDIISEFYVFEGLELSGAEVVLANIGGLLISIPNSCLNCCSFIKNAISSLR